MIRKSFLMRVNPDQHAEYEKWRACMKSITPFKTDNSSKSKEFKEVFYIE